MVSNCSLISKYSSPITNPLGIVPKAPTTTDNSGLGTYLHIIMFDSAWEIPGQAALVTWVRKQDIHLFPKVKKRRKYNVNYVGGHEDCVRVRKIL